MEVITFSVEMTPGHLPSSHLLLFLIAQNAACQVPTSTQETGRIVWAI